MAQNDIYNSKLRYDNFKANLELMTLDPKDRPSKKVRNAKYKIRFKENAKYFLRLFHRVEARDSSYVRRIRLIRTLMLICHVPNKDLKELDPYDMDEIVAFMFTRYLKPGTQSKFIDDVIFLWRTLLPEKDERGRIDETKTPYPVRHLKRSVDISKKTLRTDRMDFDEFEKIVNYFNDDPQLQCFITLSFESLSRPQELLYRRIGEIRELRDAAKIEVSDHGKEGTKFLQCIDSHPYLVKWLQKHPQANDPKAHIFIKRSPREFGKPLTPWRINKKLKEACKAININKPITCYSFKRFGVTFRRKRKESDMEIQHAAGWTSTRQLKTYDYSEQDDAFDIQLAKRGLIDAPKYKQYHPEAIRCEYCQTMNGFTEKYCTQCKHLIDKKHARTELKKAEYKDEYIDLAPV